LLRELIASQLVAIATRSDTGSHNRLDLIQNIVPTHYVCNAYLSKGQVENTKNVKVFIDGHYLPINK
jgi:hypothetical protein